MTIPYRFVPWARRGLARAHANADAAEGALATRPHISVGLTLQAKQDGAIATAVSGNIDLTLYGPADVIGIDQRLIVRTDPRPNSTNFEPNYLAIVDFDPPDFPWLMTPARADATDHLRPWLVLVVVERAKVAPPALRPGRPLPSILLTAAQADSELPDLKESWLWAHAQAISEVAVDPNHPEVAKQALSGELQKSPERNISRLICPRRLTPDTDYVACVVPATKGGCLRGLNKSFNDANLDVAWARPSQADVELPVYFSWTFSTGPVGDVETLARRIRTPLQFGGDQAFLDKLHHIGQRPVYVDGDHLLFNGVTPGQTVFEGAMVSRKFVPAPSGDGGNDFAGKLANILNSGPQRVANGTPADPVTPTLAPPIYGEFPAKRHTVEQTKIDQHWLDGLSLQPRYRLAAGWGAEVVRQNQDEFMQAAWEQLGDILAAERAFSLARLARDVLKRVEVRHLAKLSPERLLAVMAPSRARIALAPAESLYGRMADATLPQELFDGSMRRLASPRRATFRMARWRERNLAQASITVQMGALVNSFANASTRLAAIDPNRFVPDGILGSKSYDKVPLPADLATVVDMKPYTGLDFTLTGNQIKTIQAANAAARQAAATTKKTAPLMGDVWHQGLLTETHAIRLVELQSVAKAPLQGDIGRLIQRSSVRGTEGVLLSVQDGVVTSQALRIDGRSGTLKTVGRAMQVTPTGTPMRAPTSLVTAVAAVPLPALKAYGNAAVFASLPPSTLGRSGAEVRIGLNGPGDFSKVAPGKSDAVATITMPPALKDRETLQRFSTAFKEYQQVVMPPAGSLVIMQAVDFATNVNATRARARIDADRTVPARLASSLSLGGQTVSWNGSAFSNAYISASLDVANVGLNLLRYVVPASFDRVMAYPHLPFPLSRKLEVIAPDVFLPGVGVLPDDFIMAVKTNPRFVEALMVGANHEMGREMLWRGLPTDQRGTPFQHFWQRLDGKNDIEPIHQWHAVPLGTQPGNTPLLVLIIRGQLLVRVPNLSIYAYKRAGQETRPGGVGPPDDLSKEMDPTDATKMFMPLLRGHLGRDISYIGFDIDPDKMGDYFFVIEEHMTEPRFGFDERVGDGQNSNKWQDVDWVDIGVLNGKYFGLRELKLATPGQGWVNPHAAMVADAALQRPFRGYWKGDALKTPGE